MQYKNKCPFCGCADLTIEDQYDDMESWELYLSCNKCNKEFEAIGTISWRLSNKTVIRLKMKTQQEGAE